MIVSKAFSQARYYDKNGNIINSVIGKNGKERNVTIADARVMSLVPSVTTILKIKANEGLDIA